MGASILTAPPRRWGKRAAMVGFLVSCSIGLPGPVTAQMGAGMSTGAKLELTSVPAEARTAFFDGVGDMANVFMARGLSHLEEALKLDEGFGLARVFWATQAPMTAEARTKELDRGVSDAAGGSVGEATFAMAIRAQRLNRPDEAAALFGTARALLPGDPFVAYYGMLGSLGPNATLGERIVRVRKLTTQFPDLAPAYNTLAYSLYPAGDHAGALKAVRRYAELAPNHPNAKDSYAEILQWEGRFDEAVAQYRAAVALDPSYIAGYTGIAEVRQLQGRGNDARAALAEGIAVAPTAAAKANLQRLVGLSFALDGDRKGAEGALKTAMDMASTENQPGLISGIHRDYAMVNAMTGNGTGVAGHLQATINPNPTLMTVDAMMLAAVGMNADAEANLAKAEADSSAAENPYLQSHAPLVRGMILVNQNKADAALAEVANGDITIPLAHAIEALAEQQLKHPATARLLRDQVLSDSRFALGNRELVMARALATRVK